MDVNRDAPALARSETEIAADRETIWGLLTGFEEWPSWNPDVSSVTMEGGLQEGAVVRWKAGRATITSTLREIERPHVLGWTGKTVGIRAVHVWRLDAREGATFVHTEESWEGVMVRLLRRSLRTSLQKALDDGLGHLKAEAERRALSRS